MCHFPRSHVSLRPTGQSTCQRQIANSRSAFASTGSARDYSHLELVLETQASGMEFCYFARVNRTSDNDGPCSCRNSSSGCRFLPSARQNQAGAFSNATETEQVLPPNFRWLRCYLSSSRYQTLNALRLVGWTNPELQDAETDAPCKIAGTAPIVLER